ncbi:HD domain-containing phosphohydrolase [Scatolibacter rhodanostii]|uniref:HD domain-containing phosphohydrolase n=1 Tax=Scatolibacter rhodanostii TaxID=2014781 RepID=UPI000C06A761|nr:HD domain-containing phosphohydrolase [Scatolibacter rhodanostii]
MSYNKKYFSNLYDLLICITKAVDLISPETANHHQQVAFIAYELSETLNLSIEDKQDVVLASLVHDLGSLSLWDKLDFMDELPDHVHQHSFIGAKLLGGFPLLSNAANMIKFHHVPWQDGAGSSFMGESVPILSHLIHLADRIAVSIDHTENIISQIKTIRDFIVSGSGSIFPPQYIDSFLQIYEKEAFWLDLTQKSLKIHVYAGDNLPINSIQLTLDEVVELTQIFSRIIDSRSPFTAMHSAGVAATAEKLAQLSNFSENDCKKMRIAGNLHDIGKLAIPREILEKNDKLIPEEFDVIRSHTYYSYRLLQPIQGFNEIAEWAAYHHEKLNGRGYPFHLSAPSLSLGSQIMAVADIFTAITEDRPYRVGMNRNQTEKILAGMAEHNGISSSIFHLLQANYDCIAELRKTASEQASHDYKYLLIK